MSTKPTPTARPPAQPHAAQPQAVYGTDAPLFTELQHVLSGHPYTAGLFKRLLDHYSEKEREHLEDSSSWCTKPGPSLRYLIAKWVASREGLDDAKEAYRTGNLALVRSIGLYNATFLPAFVAKLPALEELHACVSFTTRQNPSVVRILSLCPVLKKVSMRTCLTDQAWFDREASTCPFATRHHEALEVYVNGDVYKLQQRADGNRYLVRQKPNLYQ